MNRKEFNMFFKTILKKLQIEIDDTFESIFGIAAMVLVELWLFALLAFSIFTFIPTSFIIGTKIVFVIIAIIFGGFIVFNKGGIKSKKF